MTYHRINLIHLIRMNYYFYLPYSKSLYLWGLRNLFILEFTILPF
nr:MAG TPA: hypothetical protein [Caudoviricetes sp.]